MNPLETATRSKEKIPFFISPLQYFALLSHALGTCARSCYLHPISGILHPISTSVSGERGRSSSPASIEIGPLPLGTA